MLESYFPCHYNDVQKGFLIELAPEAVGTGGTGETGLAGTIILLFVVQVQPLKKSRDRDVTLWFVCFKFPSINSDSVETSAAEIETSFAFVFLINRFSYTLPLQCFD